MRLSHWCLLLVVAASLWLVVRHRESPPVARSTGGGEPATSPAVASGAAPARPLPREPVAVEREHAVGQHVVRVVASLPDGAPAAGAVVRYGAFPKHPFVVRKAAEDREAYLATEGKNVVADGDGVATLVLGEGAGAMLSLRCGEHYGEAAVDDDADEVRVALERDVPLPVQLLDSDGRPRQGFRIAANMHVTSRCDGDFERDVRLSPTDANGMTCVPHTQRSTAMPGPGVIAWRMVLRSESDPVVERTVTADEIGKGEPLVLRVPAGGQIAVDVLDADGKWLWASVWLEDATTGQRRDDDGCEGNWFRQLPLGRRWTVVVHSFGHEVRRDVPGPTRVDEVVRQRIQLPLRRFSLRGRVVRPDGAPIPQAKVRLSAPPARCWHDETDSRDGSIGDRIGDFDFGGVLPADVEAVAGASLHVERAPYCAPTTIALAPLHRGENDLGNVVVSVAPDEVLLASVEVRAGGRNVSSGAHAFVCGRGDSGINTVNSFDAAHDDRITFHGPPTTRELEIGCSCAGFLTKRVPVLLGQHVAVDLEPAASLSVHLLLPPVPRALWTAELTDSQGSDHGSYYRTDDGFDWNTLEPGRYRLRLLVDGEPVHEVPSLDLAAGENACPPHGAIDLTRSAQAFRVDIGTVDGGEVERPQCFVLAADRTPPPTDLAPWRMKANPPGWFVPRREPVDLVVTAEGFVPVSMPGPSADTAVLMTRCTTLRVRTAQGEGTNTIVRVVEDAVRDPWVRALDTGNLHNPREGEARDDPLELPCVPGTVVEVVVERSGVQGAPQRVVVGREPVEVTAR